MAFNRNGHGNHRRRRREGCRRRNHRRQTILGDGHAQPEIPWSGVSREALHNRRQSLREFRRNRARQCASTLPKANDGRCSFGSERLASPVASSHQRAPSLPEGAHREGRLRLRVTRESRRRRVHARATRTSVPQGERVGSKRTTRDRPVLPACRKRKAPRRNRGDPSHPRASLTPETDGGHRASGTERNARLTPNVQPSPTDCEANTPCSLEWRSVTGEVLCPFARTTREESDE